MKKTLSLFLALVMALSLCVTAFAGNATGSTVLRLTGDAADQVVDLKSGQRLSADSSTLVRLNVLDDPSAEEYTVMLDGEKLTPDHSTSQYHFYAVPAAKSPGVATLDVSTRADVGANAVSIATAKELAAFRDRVNNGETTLNAILTADIALNKSETWTPIGTSDTMYAGIFDGNGHTISGLNVTGANNGLFKMTGAATIQNLTISDSTIGDSSNSSLLGAFVGRIKDSTTLINCHTTDTVIVSGGAVGGLVGGTDTANVAFTLTMERCSNAATVSGYAISAQMGVGGLVGVLRNGGTIKDCFNTGTVTNKSTNGSAAVGGLVGSVYNNSDLKTPLTLTDVYNTGSITAASSGTRCAGGLVGNAAWGFEMTNAYGTMTVKVGDSYGGIIVGTVQNTVSVSNIYSELIRGKNADCHVYLNDGASKMSAVEDNKMFNDTEMKAPNKLLAKLGGAFAEDTANINKGYPVLAWQNAAPESAAQLTVSVGGVEVPVTLPTDGSTNPSAPTAVPVEFENPGSDAMMDRIYFNMPEGVTLGTGLSKGVIFGELTKLDAGYTGDQLFFYKDPQAQKKSVYAIWNDGTVDHYYTITVKRAPQEGYVLAPGRSSNESNPASANTYDAVTGCVTAWIKGDPEAPSTYHDLTLFNAGKASTTTASPAFPADETGLYYLKKDDITVYFARPGRYWIPASVEKDGVTYDGEAPFWATWTLTVLNAQLDKAKAVQESEEFKALPENVKTQFNAVVERLTAGRANMSGFVMLRADGKIAGDGDTATKIQARDLGGKPILTERLLEGDECALLDLMAIFGTYKTDKALGQYHAEAYAKIAALNVNSFTDVTTAAQKTLYSQVKQAKWDLLKTTDLEGINKILTSLNLENITPAEPQVTVGDINGDGKIDIKDVNQAILAANSYVTLTDKEQKAADVNGDSLIDIKDVNQLVLFANGYITSFTN